MTTEEIQEYVESSIRPQFEGYTSETQEMMTSEGGDGRFVGKVIATRYSGLPVVRDIFLAIGETEKGVQIVKLGRSETLTPDEEQLDVLIQKELGIAPKEG